SSRRYTGAGHTCRRRRRRPRRIPSQRGLWSCSWIAPGANVEAHEHFFRVREVADDLFDRLRQVSHERRDRENLIAAPELRIFQQVDDVDAVFTVEIFGANLLQIGERSERLRRLPGDIEPQLPYLVGRFCRFFFCCVHAKLLYDCLRLFFDFHRPFSSSARRIRAISSRSAASFSSRSRSSAKPISSSWLSTSYEARKAAICASRAARLRSSS